MSDSDTMRAEFEKWADSKCMSRTRFRWDSGTISEYAYTATFDAWQVWQAAYQAGRKAEQEANCEQQSLAARVESKRTQPHPQPKPGGDL